MSIYWKQMSSEKLKDFIQNPLFGVFGDSEFYEQCWRSYFDICSHSRDETNSKFHIWLIFWSYAYSETKSWTWKHPHSNWSRFVSQSNVRKSSAETSQQMVIIIIFHLFFHKFLLFTTHQYILCYQNYLASILFKKCLTSKGISNEWA